MDREVRMRIVMAAPMMESATGCHALASRVSRACALPGWSRGLAGGGPATILPTFAGGPYGWRAKYRDWTFRFRQRRPLADHPVRRLAALRTQIAGDDAGSRRQHPRVQE